MRKITRVLELVNINLLSFGDEIFSEVFFNCKMNDESLDFVEQN